MRHRYSEGYDQSRYAITVTEDEWVDACLNDPYVRLGEKELRGIYKKIIRAHSQLLKAIATLDKLPSMQFAYDHEESAADEALWECEQAYEKALDSAWRLQRAINHICTGLKNTPLTPNQ